MQRPGSRTLPGRELTQLYGQEIRGNKGRVSYSLFALDKQGRKEKLLSNLDDKDQVLYLEQALERRLGIEDSPVDGELAPLPLASHRAMDCLPARPRAPRPAVMTSRWTT